MRTPEMLPTKSYEILRDRFLDAQRDGVNSIVYGPPSSEKSFVLKSLCDRHKPSIYAYCGPRTTENFLYRTIAEAAGIPVRSSLRWANRFAVIRHLQACPVLPAIVLDEAQHLDVDALEGVRQIHDITGRDGRPGCGIILAGSHNLLREFLSPLRRARLEQTLSRFPQRVQLEGMTKEEIVDLASRAFGNGKPAKLSEEHQKRLLSRCTVEDPYFVDENGRPSPRTYYSSRRLLEYIRQQKKNFQVVEGLREAK